MLKSISWKMVLSTIVEALVRVLLMDIGTAKKNRKDPTQPR